MDKFDTLDTGEYELRLPCHNPIELVMDILKYGENFEVTAPAELRRQVAEKLVNVLRYF